MDITLMRKGNGNVRMSWFALDSLYIFLQEQIRTQAGGAEIYLAPMQGGLVTKLRVEGHGRFFIMNEEDYDPDDFMQEPIHQDEWGGRGYVYFRSMPQRVRGARA